jgi:hypothetical protein
MYLEGLGGGGTGCPILCLKWYRNAISQYSQAYHTRYSFPAFEMQVEKRKRWSRWSLLFCCAINKTLASSARYIFANTRHCT